MTTLENGGERSPPFSPMRGFATPDMARDCIRKAVARNLPALKLCKAHKLKMAIVGGGPSLEDTLGEITGYVAAVNKAHDYLISKGMNVHACGLVDPAPWLSNYITPKKGATYFVASLCHAFVFDKLAEHNVVLWHASQGEKVPMNDIVPSGSVMIPGGTTMAVRWLDLGYALGFREFDLFGLDSSHRGAKHHAYDFPQDDAIPTQELMGYVTTNGWLAQVNDIFLRTKRFEMDARDGTMDPIEITFHGDGLLQHLWKQNTGSLIFRTK